MRTGYVLNVMRVAGVYIHIYLRLLSRSVLFLYSIYYMITLERCTILIIIFS